MDNKALTGCILVFMLLLSAFISLSILFMTQTEQATNNDEELAMLMKRRYPSSPRPELDPIGLGIDQPSRNELPDRSSPVPSLPTGRSSTVATSNSGAETMRNQQPRTKMLAVISSPMAGGKFVGVEATRDGKLLYLPKSDGQMELYNVESPTRPHFLRSIDMPRGVKIHRAKLLHSSGQFVIIDAGMRHMLRVDGSGKMVGHVVEFPDFQAIDVATTPNDIVCVLARSRNEVHCYSEKLVDSRLIKFKSDNDGDHCRFIEASGQDLFVSCLSAVIQIERESGREVRKLTHVGSAYSLAVSYMTDGRLLVAEGRHGDIEVFNTHAGGAPESIISPSSPNVSHVWTGIRMIGGDVLAALNHMSGRIHLFPLY